MQQVPYKRGLLDPSCSQFAGGVGEYHAVPASLRYLAAQRWLVAGNWELGKVPSEKSTRPFFLDPVRPVLVESMSSRPPLPTLLCLHLVCTVP